MHIESERLIIRSVQRGDEKVFAEMAKDGSLSEIGFDENCSEWIGDWIKEAVELDEKDDPRVDYIALSVCIKEDGRVIGSVGSTYYEDAARIGICYFIGTEYRNKGYASEAVEAYLRYFFEHYNEDEIAAVILAGNALSCKTAEKAGFVLNSIRMYKDIYDDKEELYCFYSIQSNRDIFYHVISDRPKTAGEHFCVDEAHPNGVWDRVQAEADTVKDIREHPEKYEGHGLEHHTDVALRELALEKVRKEKFPQYPSRMASLYVSRDYKEAEQWADYFVKLGRPVYGIAKIKVKGKVFYGDACKCFDGSVNEEENLHRAEIYWQNWGKDDGQDPIVEVLADGEIEVLEIMKEINAKLKEG
ncbi:MAG: GNAT family N-acetyltransferase [Lachnospiraceae bacterium]|nr:GNAT family N-acetyltransferase [Lachnospiraceae bacterium]